MQAVLEKLSRANVSGKLIQPGRHLVLTKAPEIIIGLQHHTRVQHSSHCFALGPIHVRSGNMTVFESITGLFSVFCQRVPNLTYVASSLIKDHLFNIGRLDKSEIQVLGAFQLRLWSSQICELLRLDRCYNWHQRVQQAIRAALLQRQVSGPENIHNKGPLHRIRLKTCTVQCVESILLSFGSFCSRILILKDYNLPSKQTMMASERYWTWKMR